MLIFIYFIMLCKELFFWDSSAGCTSQLWTKPIKQFCTATPRRKLIIKLLLNLKRVWFFGSLGTSVRRDLLSLKTFYELFLPAKVNDRLD